MESLVALIKQSRFDLLVSIDTSNAVPISLIPSPSHPIEAKYRSNKSFTLPQTLTDAAIMPLLFMHKDAFN